MKDFKKIVLILTIMMLLLVFVIYLIPNSKDKHSSKPIVATSSFALYDNYKAYCTR